MILIKVEFGRIHFMKRAKTTEELENFKNPKREITWKAC